MVFFKINLIVFLTFGAFIAKMGGTTPTSMNAVIMCNFGNAEVLRQAEVVVPKVGSKQILVNVKAAGINPVDTYIRAGTYVIKPELPAILGKEIAGIVEDVESSATIFKKGDRVFCGILNGGYAEYAVAYEKNCYPLSKKLSFSQGASIFITYFTAVRGLVLMGNIEEGNTVFIQGASGSLGSASIQIAKMAGAQVVTSVRHHEVENVMKKVGADCVVYHDDQNYLGNALKLINKTGFDIIFHILGKVNIEHDKEVLSKNGRIILVGNRMPPMLFNDTSEVDPTVYAIRLFKYTRGEQDAASEYVLNGIRIGMITPVVAHEYKLYEASKAHDDITYNQAETGKLVFVM